MQVQHVQHEQTSLVSLQILSDDEGSLAVVGSCQFLNPAHAQQTLQGSAIPGKHNVNFQTVSDLLRRFVSTK